MVQTANAFSSISQMQQCQPVTMPGHAVDRMSVETSL